MSEDIYVYEAIDIDPPVTEAEIDTKIGTGEYQKVAWEDDSRVGDGYFVKVGERGMIGIAMMPELDEHGELCHQGIAVQANPLDEDHRHATIESELRKLVDDFGTAPDGTSRRFARAIYIQIDDAEHKVFVDRGEVVRVRVEETPTKTPDESLLTLTITKHEVDLLRQMVALDIHDHKAGDVPIDSHDPEHNQRRIADSRTLLAKLNNLLG